MNRRQKERKLQFRSSFPERISSDDGPKPSFIYQINQLKAKSKVGILVRVSYRNQKQDGSLDRQEKSIREKTKRMEITKVFRHVGSGKLSQFKSRLKKIMKELRKRDTRYLVVMTPSRLIRSEKFNAIKNPDAMPNEKEWSELEKLAREEGIQFVTISEPDCTMEQDRLFLANAARKTIQKEKTIGKKKAKQMVIEMGNMGWSSRKIAEYMKGKGFRITSRTVSRWMKKKEE